MRIISGEFGGRRFDTPRGLQARPTTDIAKESLFNILQNRLDFEEIKALDLFAGTGSISFELLSRGASHVTAVEMARVQQQFILHVAQELKIPSSRLQLVRGDVFKYLRVEWTDHNLRQSIAAKPFGHFDFIFADPPYALPELPQLPHIIFNSSILHPDGLFVLEHGKEYDFSSHPHFMELRKYGAVHFSFFK